MKSVKDKEFDDLFKNSLQDAESNSGYLEDDWADLELMLDKPRKKRGIVFWLPVLSSAAAILIFLGLWLFKPVVSPVVKPQTTVAVNSTQEQSGTTSHESQQSEVKSTAVQPNTVKQTGTPQTKSTSSALAMTSRKKDKNKTSLYTAIAKNQTANQYQSPAILDNGKNAKSQQSNTQLAINRERSDLFTGNAMLAVNSLNNQNIVFENVEAKTAAKTASIQQQAPVKAKITKAGNSIFAARPQFALSVIGAPEVNGVGTFADAKSGTNIGLLFSAGIFKKITISTGATYATMPYNTDIANYHTAYTFKNNPSQIEANCQALDIPINVDYQLYNNHQNKFSIGTGLSSYIMLHESYDYYYNNPSASGPAGYTVPNHGKYLFGIANIQATYTRQVNSKFGVSVQPYLKLPLTNIGYSQAKLQTAGVAVGVSWNINALTKP